LLKQTKQHKAANNMLQVWQVEGLPQGQRFYLLITKW